jgi:uncharacterized membrane protein
MKNKIALFCIAALVLAAGVFGSVAIVNAFAGNAQLALFLFAGAFLFGYVIGVATHAVVFRKQ